LAPINSDPRFAAATTPGTVGTSRWSAPEITNPPNTNNGMPPVESKAADVFAFSMFAIEVFTGKIPFEGKTQIMSALCISRGNRPEKPVNAKAVGLTNEMWILLESCWQQDPEKRPTMEEVARRWQGFIQKNDNIVTECVQITLVIPFSTCYDRPREPRPPVGPTPSTSRPRTKVEAVRPRTDSNAIRPREKSVAVKQEPKSEVVQERTQPPAPPPSESAVLGVLISDSNLRILEHRNVERNGFVDCLGSIRCMTVIGPMSRFSMHKNVPLCSLDTVGGKTRDSA